MRTSVRALCVAVFSLFAGASGAWAQAYPARPVELVVHTAAGGGGTIAFNYVAGKRGDP